MNNKLLSIIAVFIGLVLPIKMQAQVAADELYAPEFNFEGDNLVMTCETQGAIIYYSMSEFTDDDEAYDLADNMEVNEYTGTAYTEPIPITKNVVIKAIAKMPQMQGGSDYKVLIYNYTSWKQLLEAIDYGTDVLDRAQNNPNVSDDLKQDLQWALEEGHHFYQERGMMYDSYEAVMIRQHILEIAQQIEDIIGQQTNPEPYAVLSNNNTVLTFYYDEKKAERNGMSVGPFTQTYDQERQRLNINSGWDEIRENITTVVFDASFVNCTTLTSTAYWFYGFNHLTTITGISNLKTDNVTNMSSMFSACTSLTSLDVTGFNTQNITDMGYMFNYCPSLTSLDVTHFNTQNVTNMFCVFSHCSSLTSLDVTHFNTQNVTNMGSMFDECSGLTSLDVTGFNTQNVTNMGSMFDGCSGLTSLDVTGFNTQNVTDMYAMFSDCSGLTSLDVTHFNTQNVTEMGFMFDGCSGLTSLDVTGFNTQNVVSMHDMFLNCSGLTSLDVSNFNTAKVESMESMFGGCINLTALDVSGFRTDNVTNMTRLFYGCSGLTSLDVSNFNTEKVTGMGAMFNYCTRLTDLDLSHFITNNVTTFEIMFQDCYGLTTLDLSNFNTAKAENMVRMFDRCTGLKTIYVGEGWSTTSITQGAGMFTNCNSLVGGAGTTFDANHTDYTYAHIDGGTANPGYFTDKNAPAPTEPEPYAVLSQNNTVLTFYYDDQKEARNGMGVGPFRYNYDSDNQRINISSEWDEQRESITTVVFDASFANCTTIENTAYWFCQFKNLTTIRGIDYLNTQNVTDMQWMFEGCSSLANLDVSTFNTENVRNMGALFGGCSGLTTLDLSNFNTSRVTDMNQMFGNCTGLTSLDLSNFNTSNVQYMFGMFNRCTSLTHLDLSNFETRNVKRMDWMFDECRSLISLNISSFDTSNLEERGDIQIYLCTSLASVQAGNAYIPVEEYTRIGNPNLLVYVNEPSQAPEGIQNVVINGQAKEIVLTDVTTGNNNWHCPEPFTAEKISYTRNFRQQTQVGISRGWESITLPFNVQTITHETKGQIIPFGAQGNGKYFWLRGYSPEGLHRATAIEANKPYVISMPNNTEVYPSEYNLNGRVTFSAENTTVPATPELDSMIIVRDNIAMMPNYRWIPQNEYVYAINVGQPVDRYAEGSVFTRNLRDVRPFEAYTVHAEVNGARPNNIRIAAQPKYDITGIKDIENDSIEGPWYSLDGHQMQSQPQKKGIYIQNGKKVVIK